MTASTAVFSPGAPLAQGRYEGSTEARRLYEEGQRLEQKAANLKANRPEEAQELYTDALDKYQEAIDTDADFLDAYIRIGYVFYALGDPRAAAGRLEPALKRWPKDPDLRRVYGTVIYDLPGRRQDAVGHLEAAAKASKDQFDVFYLLGKHYYEARQYNKAARHLRRYLALKPDDAVIHGTLGNVYLKTDKLEPALAEFRLVLSLDPGNLPAQINIANIRFKQKRYAEAVELFKEVLKADPDQTNVHFNLASALYQLERFDEAIANYKAFAITRPSHVTSRYMVGLCERRLGRRLNAMEAFKQAVKIDPKHARSHWHIGVLLMADGKLADARARLEAAHNLAPKDPWIVSSLGDALRRQGKIKKAIERHQQAISMDGKVSDFHAALGRDHFADGALADAVASLDKAHRIEPLREDLRRPLSTALLHRGRALIEAGNAQDALKDGQEVLRLATHKAEGHLLAASAQMALGKLDDADDHVKAARKEAAAPCQSHCPMPYVRRAAARLALRRKDYAAALAELTPLLKNNRAPDAAVANDLGLASAGDRQWPQALQWFLAARKMGMAGKPIERNIALSCIQVAQVLGEEGQWRDAVAILDTAKGLKAQLGPAEVVALDLAFSNAYAEIGSFNKAQRLLAQARKALRKLPADERARLPNDDALALDLRQAYILLRLRRFDAALRLAEKLPRKGARADDVKKVLAVAYSARALEFFRRGNRAQARRTLAKASKVTRASDIIKHNLAVLDYLDGKKAKAGKVFGAMSKRGAIAESLYNYAIYLDDVKNDDRGAYEVFKRVAAMGGARAAEASRIVKAKQRVFGFE